MTPETHRFADDGAIPNSPLPVLVYHGVEAATEAGDCEALFGANGWGGHWRSGILTRAPLPQHRARGPRASSPGARA